MTAFTRPPRPNARPRVSAIGTLLLIVSLAVTALSASASHQPGASEEDGCAVTLGGWGGSDVGNTPGHILQSFFDDVYPDGLSVGPKFYADADAVQTDLREGLGDIFLEETIALALNIGFGDAGYLNGESISTVEVDDGTNIYDGLTAVELLPTAEDYLDDPGGYTHEEREGLLDAMDAFNNELYGCAERPDSEAPPAVPCPENVLAVAQTDGDILVSWDEVDESLEYRVYRAVGDGGFTMVTQTSDLEYLDTDTTAGETYRYLVNAYDTESELESEGCDEVQATAIPFFPGVIGAAVAVLCAVGAVFVMRRR